MVSHANGNSYILHGACERIVTLLERGVDVVLACHLVAHLDALVEEDLVSFLDFFFGVMGGHCCKVSVSKKRIGWLQLDLVIFYFPSVPWRYQAMVWYGTGELSFNDICSQNIAEEIITQPEGSSRV